MRVTTVNLENQSATERWRDWANACSRRDHRPGRGASPLVSRVGVLALTAFGVTLCPAPSQAQLSVEASYGVDRNVESSESEVDGWLNVTVDWIFPSGLGIGIGTDHQFEGASISSSQHLAWALYVSPSFELPLGAVAPFVRGGVGLGRAPCRSDTCGDGAYLRGSTGIRVRVVEKLRITGEIGVSRVSRPFAGVGLSFRF